PFARFGEGQAGPTARAETGMSDEINLTSVGQVDVNDEVAFTVAATDRQGRPKLDLPADQRLRGATLEHYPELDGIWGPAPAPPPTTGLQFHPSPLPDLGPGSYYREFTVRARRAGGLFVADPARLGTGMSVVPVLDHDPEFGRPMLFGEFTGTLARL